jgi:hypothetical protein
MRLERILLEVPIRSPIWHNPPAAARPEPNGVKDLKLYPFFEMPFANPFAFSHRSEVAGERI